MTTGWSLRSSWTVTGSPAPAVVWDERYGWRTVASRRHPITKGAVLPSEGEGVRYLAGGIAPPPGDVVAALTAPDA
ncbi:hypothetical protein ACWD7M_37085 [Streptomyces griseus]